MPRSSSEPPRSYPELLRGVGARIRELRTMRGLLLVQLAATIELDAGGLSRIEHGKANFTLRTAERIARGLRVPPHELFVPPALSEVEPCDLESPRTGAAGADERALRELLEHVGSRIRELREFQGLSVPLLADYVGLMSHRLAEFEAGKVNLTLRVADRIARGIGVYTYELFIPRERSEIQLSAKGAAAQEGKKATKPKKAKKAGARRPGRRGARRDR